MIPDTAAAAARALATNSDQVPPLKLADFWDMKPIPWFDQAESQFTSHTSLQKFNAVIRAYTTSSCGSDSRHLLLARDLGPVRDVEKKTDTNLYFPDRHQGSGLFETTYTRHYVYYATHESCYFTYRAGYPLGYLAGTIH